MTTESTGSERKYISVCTHETLSPGDVSAEVDVGPLAMEVEANPGVEVGELANVGVELAVSDGDGVDEGVF